MTGCISATLKTPENLSSLKFGKRTKKLSESRSFSSAALFRISTDEWDRFHWSFSSPQRYLSVCWYYRVSYELAALFRKEIDAKTSTSNSRRRPCILQIVCSTRTRYSRLESSSISESFPQTRKAFSFSLFSFWPTTYSTSFLLIVK